MPRTHSRKHRAKKKGFKPSFMKIITAIELLAVILTMCFSTTPAVQSLFGDTGKGRPAAAWAKGIRPYPEGYKPVMMAWQYRPMSLSAVPMGVDAITPTWFYVEADEEGKAVLRDLFEMGYSQWQPEEYLKTAHQGHAQVWGCVVSFDPELSRQVVCENTRQKEFIEKLCACYKRYHLDGINFDFEKMDPANAAQFIRLVSELKKALPKDAVVSVSVTVPLGYDDPANWYQCYDRAGLAQACDYIIIMAYDSDTLASAPYDWVEEHIQLALEEVPSDKLIAALPFYGSHYIYRGEENQPEAKRNITPKTMEDILGTDDTFEQGQAQYTITEWIARGEYNEKWMVYKYEFLDSDGARHVIYMDTPETIRQKGTLIPRYALAGAGIWQMNMGTEALFSGLRNGIDTESEDQK